jgi:hypothetical protein
MSPLFFLLLVTLVICYTVSGNGDEGALFELLSGKIANGR